MLPLTSHSRRALVATAGLLAAAPAAEAKKKKGKKKKKPVSLAFAVVTVTDITVTTDPATFTCALDSAWRYPAEEFRQSISPEVQVASDAAGDQIRAQIEAAVKDLVANELAFLGHNVPADRIAVTLL